MGIKVRDVTLFVFGGVARIAREPSRPAQEFVIALAGPVVSVGIGTGLLFGAAAANGLSDRFLWTIGAANIALAAFNLLPGFPLDGGRILRAVLWARSGDPHRATIRASRAGQFIGLLLVAGGMVLFVGEQAERLEGGTAEGLWLAVVGAFLHVLATASRRAARVAAMLRDQSAGGWARPFAGTLSADVPMARVAAVGSAPIAVSDNGRLTGVLLPAHMAKRLPDDRVREAMIPWTPRLTFPAAQPLSRALERLAATDAGVLVVVDEHGAALGILDHGGVRERLRRTRNPAEAS
jgi:Zn-dependent protease